MKLKYLAIDRMPGFKRQGFIYQENMLNSGITLIVGPNGSGKTTSCLAIRALLWPSTLKECQPIALHSIWDDNGQIVEIARDGSQHRIHPPQAEKRLRENLPADRHASCYTLTLDDLASASDAEFAMEIAREASGGYDLAHVRQLPNLALARYHGRSEKNELDASHRALRKIQSEQAALHQKERSLHILEQQIHAARQAKEKIACLKDALTVKDLELALQILNCNLQSFPSHMERLRGDELENLHKWKEQECTIRSELLEIEKKIEMATKQRIESQIKQTNIPSEKESKKQCDYIEQLKDLEKELRRAKKSCNEEKVRVEEHCRYLAIPSSALENLFLEQVAEMRNCWQRQMELQSERQEIERRIEMLSEHPCSNFSNYQLRQGIHLLEQWLQIHASNNAPSRKHLLSYSFFLLALLPILPALLANVYWIFLSVPTIACYALLWKGNSPSQQCDQKQRYQQLRLPEPTHWTDSEIQKLLDQLEKLWGESARYQADSGLRDDLIKKQQIVEEKCKIADCALVQLQKEAGFASELTSITPAIFLDTLKEARQALIKMQQLQHAQLQIAHSQSDILGAINLFFSSNCCQSAIDFLEAEAELTAFNTRIQTFQRAETDLALAKQTQRSLQFRLQTIGEEQQALLKRCACQGIDAEEQLNSRINRHVEYIDCMHQKMHRQTECEIARNRMHCHSELLSLNKAELEAKQIELSLIAEQFEELLDRRTTIKREVEVAERDNALEGAHTLCKNKEALFEECFSEACFSAAGNFLLQIVEEQHQRESQPRIFSKANQWLLLFSQGTYSLQPPLQMENTFQLLAFDTRSKETKRLEELSRGTRIQLLLAVRLAFSTCNENPTYPLPFFFDETLNNIDSEKFHAVGKALIAMAREGRQIFYFTCRTSDARAWQEIAASCDNYPLTTIDLAAVKNSLACQIAPLPLPSEQEISITPPVESSLTQYALDLQIPGINLRLPVGEVHIYHLLQTPTELYYLRLMQITSYGQIKALARLGKMPVLLGSENSWMKIAAKGILMETFFELWQIGRGKEITVEVLEKAGVSEKFMPNMAAIAKEVDYNAARLLNTVEARQDERLKGFRKTICMDMKEYFLAEGHLDERSPITPEQFQFELLRIAAEDIEAGILSREESTLFIKNLLKIDHVIYKVL